MKNVINNAYDCISHIIHHMVNQKATSTFIGDLIDGTTIELHSFKVRICGKQSHLSLCGAFALLVYM